MNREEILNLQNAGKYQLGYLQSSSSNWMAFLSKACNHYSRSFLEQLLITAIFPNATAIMEESLWQKNKFVVKDGEIGIAVFENFDGDFYDNQKLKSATTKVYYDISQVEKISGKDIYRWSIGDVNENIVIKFLEDNYTNVNTSTFAHSVITAISAEVNIRDTNLKNFIVNSASYQVLSRCGYNANSIFKSEDFNLVTKFKGEKEFIKVATTSNELSSNMLKHIAKVVRKHYNKNEISVKEEQDNGHNIQSERRPEQRRTNDYFHRVSQERNQWSVNSDSGSDRRRTDGAGSVRSEAPELSQGEQPSEIHRADVAREHNRISTQHRDDSTKSQGNNHRATEGSTGSNRGTERERPDEMGRLDEQHNSISRGDSSSRDSLRLISNQQVNNTDEKAEVDVKNQTSAFSIPQQVIDDTLCLGSPFQDSKMRIYEQFEKNLSSKDNAKFLKKEYGIGGSSKAGGHKDYSIMHDTKGISITRDYGNKEIEVLFSWKDVATRIYQLIRMDRFLNPKEKEYYPKWLEEKEAKKAERLQQEKSNEVSPAEKENEEYIYDYNVDDTVYLGSSRYQITSVSNDDTVFLYNTQFPLLEKEMKLEEFENALKESVYNDHLKIPKSKINSYTNYFRLYELKKDSKYREYRDKYELTIEECEKRGIELTQDDYDLICEGDWDKLKGANVYEKLNYIAVLYERNPKKINGFSTTASNVIVFGNKDGQSAYYIDKWKHQEFPQFFKKKELEQTVDMIENPKSTNNSYANYYRIYQLKDTSDYHGIRFQDSDTNARHGVKLNHDDYDLIYEGNWDELKGISSENRLEYIWEKFNIDIPENFRGHSLSVSDVITVGNENIQTAYYVDSIGFTDFPQFFKEKELEQVVENEPLQNNIPTITCHWSEHSVFEKGKTYSVSEFDELMRNADTEWRKNRQEEIQRYGSMEEAIEDTGVTYQGYAKTKFTLNMPDGSRYTERQDIGDGFGGVIDFLSQYPQYNDILPVLKEQIAIERNTPIQDVSDTANNTQSVEMDNADRNIELTFEEKAFYDILITVRDDYKFEYGEDELKDGTLVNEKCQSLAKKIKEIIDTKSSSSDWFNNQIVQDELKFDIKVCLIKNGYPPKHTPEVFRKVMEQVEKGDFVQNSSEIQSEIIHKTVDELQVDDVIHHDNQEQPISNTQSVELDNADLIGKEFTLDDRRFRVEKISMFGDVSLRDLEFERVNGFPISRVEKVELVRYALEIEAEMKKTSTIYNKTVDDLKVGDVIRLENQEWTISKINGDFSIELTNNDKTAIQSVRAFWGHWKENIAEIGYEYIPPIKESTKNIPAASAKTNYIINDDNLGVGTKPERFQNNINAIRLLKTLENENRLATQEEQEILSKYVGWGGLDKYFEPTHSRYNELRECLTDDEFTSASASTLTAFYTPPVVIRAMYKALDNLGFTNGNILEPSCGIGNFMGLLPESMQNSKMYGVELDTVSAKIAKQLYQKNKISIGGYEKEQLPDSFFDVAIGNVPFGDFKLSDKRYDKYKFLVHDYFYAKTLDKVRPGGVIAFITSKGTLDKKDNRIRKYLAERATLLGAIRLPNNTFKGAAGTEVTSDILFLQKKEALSLDNPDWLYLKENEDGIVINQYFVDNPDMVMGDIKLISGPFGLEMACVPNDDGTLEEKLNNAVAKIQGEIPKQNIIVDPDEEIENSKTVETIPADPTVKNFSYTLVDGDIYYRKDSIMIKQKQTGIPSERIRGMIKVRDIVRELIDYQTNDYSDDDIATKRDELIVEYEKFTKKYGLINGRGNKMAFSQDTSYPLLTSLEVLDEDGKLKRKSDIFYKRTIKPYIQVTKAETPAEALAISLNERGKVDIELMSKLTNIEQKQIISDLKGIIYPVPGKDEYQTADEYLSGNVREKLFVAKNALAQDSKYEANVKALEDVQPQDLTAGEVSAKLGATWIDAKYIKDFIDDVFQPGYKTYKIDVTYSPHTSKWNITNKSIDKSYTTTSTYGMKEMNAYHLLELALNLQKPKINETKEVNGKKVRVVNQQKTTIALKKQEKIQAKFEEWIFSNPQRRKDLLRKYNDTFNCIRNREYDGSHLTFPGMNPEIRLRPHQVNAIARTLYGGNTLLAHVVGAGKSFEMIASAMEARRIGLCNKSLVVVPNHLTEQMGADFLRLYPSANVLVATDKDFETQKRKEFCSRIATGDYDAVVIGHSQFEKIPVSIERQEAFIKEEIDNIIETIAETKAQDGDNFTVKQLENKKKKLQNKLEKLYSNKDKDDVVSFEQLGIDRIYIDEAHMFKNLSFYTKMNNVAGISSEGADKSADLLIKCRYIDEITGGRGIVFATGTPVSNSMSELYTMQRYLQVNTLNKLGFSQFDSWASTFASTVTAMELAPEGKKYREKTRFSKFFNLPELMSIFRECADIQTAEMLNLPTPKAHFETVVSKPSEEQKAFVDECSERAEAVRKGIVDPHDDNMLKITGDGRKLAVDQRIIDPNLPDYAGGKVNMCVNNVFDIWQKTAEQRSTQLVFCDLSTPTSKTAGEFNVYDDIRSKLIAKGIPKNEIAFIHEYKTDAQKAKLFSNVRQGKIRVLLGSTQKMGAGTNVQDKLIALHDLDVPWRPSDLEQRLGRILRQGNGNDEIFVFRYVTEDTFDAYSYQLIENKQKFISQIMSSKTPVREAEDVDQSALSYAEIKMLATGNPLIKEKMDLDIKQTNLKVLKADYLSNKYHLEDMVIKAPQDIAIKQHIIDYYNDDIDIANANKFGKDEFKITIDDVVHTNKKNGALLFAKKLEEMPHLVNTDEYPIGEYRGFRLSIARVDNRPVAYLQVNGSYRVELSDDIYGNITRLNNKVDGIEARRDNAIQELEKYKNQIEQMKLESKKPFEQEQELISVTERLEEINRMLTTSEAEVEYKGVSEVDVQALKNAGVEFDSVVDSSGKNDYIIKYEKAHKQQVQEIISDPLNSALKR